MKQLKFLKKPRLLNRKVTDPGNFEFTGEKTSERLDIQLFEYNSDDITEKKNISAKEIEKPVNDKYKYWLNIYGLNDPDVIADICRKFRIHSLIIQDILDVNQRPKYQEFEEFSFLTIKSILPANDQIYTEQISFIIGSNFLITFQEKKADYFNHIRYRLRENKGIVREKGSDFLLYTLLEAILDNYFKTLDRLETDVDNLDLVNFKEEPSPDVLKLIESNKKLVYFIKKAILPIKEFALYIERENGKIIDTSNMAYFYEIKDLCMTLLDTCDMIQSTLESNINLFFFLQGHRMNQVMKTLTIIATIFIPLTFIAGIYGMNFLNMPELHWKFGYSAVWLLMITISLLMLYYFRKKKWF